MPSTSPASAVVPCYNAEPWLNAALNSDLPQDLLVGEIIVVDDCSSERLAERVRRLYRDVTLVARAHARVAVVRNQAIKRSPQEWIAFMESDAFRLPGKLASQLSRLRRQEHTRMTHSSPLPAIGCRALTGLSWACNIVLARLLTPNRIDSRSASAATPGIAQALRAVGVKLFPIFGQAPLLRYQWRARSYM